jgi:hypothetical protein
MISPFLQQLTRLHMLQSQPQLTNKFQEIMVQISFLVVTVLISTRSRKVNLHTSRLVIKVLTKIEYVILEVLILSLVFLKNSKKIFQKLKLITMQNL